MHNETVLGAAIKTVEYFSVPINSYFMQKIAMVHTIDQSMVFIHSLFDKMVISDYNYFSRRINSSYSYLWGKNNVYENNP